MNSIVKKIATVVLCSFVFSVGSNPVIFAMKRKTDDCEERLDKNKKNIKHRKKNDAPEVIILDKDKDIDEVIIVEKKNEKKNENEKQQEEVKKFTCSVCLNKDLLEKDIFPLSCEKFNNLAGSHPDKKVCKTCMINVSLKRTHPEVICPECKTRYPFESILRLLIKKDVGFSAAFAGVSLEKKQWFVEQMLSCYTSLSKKNYVFFTKKDVFFILKNLVELALEGSDYLLLNYILLKIAQKGGFDLLGPVLFGEKIKITTPLEENFIQQLDDVYEQKIKWDEKTNYSLDLFGDVRHIFDTPVFKFLFAKKSFEIIEIFLSAIRANITQFFSDEKRFCEVLKRLNCADFVTKRWFIANLFFLDSYKEVDQHGFSAILFSSWVLYIIQLLIVTNTINDPSVFYKKIMWILTLAKKLLPDNMTFFELLKKTDNQKLQKSYDIHCRSIVNNSVMRCANVENTDSLLVEIFTFLGFVSSKIDGLLYKDTMAQETWAHFAAKNGYSSFMKYLVSKNKSLLDQADTVGSTPLHYAGIHKNKPVWEYLISVGASMEVKNIFGQKPCLLNEENDDVDDNNE